MGKHKVTELEYKVTELDYKVTELEYKVTELDYKVTELDYKVPGGKLIRLRAELEGCEIRNIRVTGDFFLHPEEAITRVEKALEGKRLEKAALGKTVRAALKGCEAVGFSADDLVEALLLLRKAA